MSAASLRREIEMLLGLSGAQAADFWRIAVPSPPSGPIPVPYPNIAAGAPRPAQSAVDRYNGQYLVIGTTHRYSQALDNLAQCVLAAAASDIAAARVSSLWLRVKNEIGREPAHVRTQLGHELTHTLQQRGR